MSQYHIDENRTLPVFVIRDELSQQKVPLSGATFSVLCSMFTHTNNEILFEDFLDFIESILLDKKIEISVVPALAYDDRCQTAPSNFSLSRFKSRPKVVQRPMSQKAGNFKDNVNEREVLLNLKTRPSSER